MQLTTEDVINTNNSFIGNWVILWCRLIVIIHQGHCCCHHHHCCIIVVKMGAHYQLLNDWVMFLLLFFMLFLLLFLCCCTPSFWRSSCITVLLLIKERLLWAFNVDGHIALKSLDELSTKILMSKYDTLLVLSSDAFFLMTLENQAIQLLQSYLVGDLLFHLVLQVKIAQLYGAEGANTKM